MLVAPLPPNEHDRLEALYSLRLLDTPQEERFDAVTLLAARLFGVPIAFVSLIDRDRQWFKAKVGFDLCEASRQASFCAHAILQDEPLVIPDALLDARFVDSPFVNSEPFLRFYAGQPLRAPGGEKVGTFCIADTKPHNFSAGELELLRHVGTMVERELRMSDIIDAQSELLVVQKELLSTQRRLHEELRAAAGYVISQFPSPIEEPLAIDWKFVPSDEVGGDGLGYHALDETRFAVYLLDVCGHGVAPALMSISLLSWLRSQARVGVDFGDPAAVLAALNRDFPMIRHGDRFFTMWYGVLDVASGKLVYSSAGHPPAVVVQEGGGMRRLGRSGIPIGCLTTATYENLESPLGSDEILYVFSDGAFELRRGEWSLEDLEARFAKQAAAPGALDAILGELRQVAGSAGFADDVTILRLRRQGAKAK